MKFHEAAKGYLKKKWGLIDGCSVTKEKTKPFFVIAGKIRKEVWRIYFLVSIIAIVGGFFMGMRPDIGIGFCVYYIVSVLVAYWLVVISSKKAHKKYTYTPLNSNIYQRELPSKMRPLHVRLLSNDGLVDEISVASTIFDLIDRGYLGIRREKNEKFSEFDIYKKGNIILQKTNKDINELLTYEKFLIEVFIDKCGDGKEVNSKQLKENLQKLEEINLEDGFFQQFQIYAFLSFPYHEMFEKRKSKIARFIVLTIFGCFFISLIPALFVYGLGCCFFANPRIILSKKGTDEKDNWEDLKKYLIDFSNIESKTPEMIKIWDFYLTYSVALGIESVAGNEMVDFFGNSIYYFIYKEEIPTLPENATMKQALDMYNKINEETKSWYGVIDKFISDEKEKY